jgi:hypothetical protein
MGRRQSNVRFGPKADIRELIWTYRKTASRRSLRNPIRYFDQAAATAAALPLPAPAGQTQGAEAGGEEWEGGRQGTGIKFDRNIIQSELP